MNRKALLCFMILGIFGLWIGLETAAATDHSGTLTSDENWDPTGNPHNIIGNVTVPNGITLHIKPCVEIFFKGNYYIRVAGEMIADGTSENPILFTKDLATTGWSQLQFYSGGTGSLSYCTIEYAYYGVNLATNAACTMDHCAIQCCTHGIYYNQSAVNPGHVITNNTIQNNKSYGAYFRNVTDALVGGGNLIQGNPKGIYFYDCDNAQVAAGNTICRNLDYGVYFGNCDQPVLLSGVSECGVGVFYQNCDNIGTIDNLTFSKNAEAALKVKNCGPFSLGSSNTITGNGWPLAIDVGAFPDPSSQIPTSGNLRNAIQIVAGSGEWTGSWPTFAGLDYVLTGNNTIQSGGDLTLSPGTTVRCQNNIYIRVDGKLNVVGTAENQILFTRHGTDSWGGIRFYVGSQGEIQHACFEYGLYGVYENLTASVPVSDCWFRHNTHGVYAAAGANIQVMGCKFHYNDYGVYLAAGGTATIGGAGEDYCCFEGNRTYAVENKNAFTITAENNSWGDPAGPNHVSHLTGRGDRVSDNVDFLPFSSTCLSFDGCISELCTSEICVPAYDPAGGDLTYTWEALDDGSIEGSGACVKFHPPESAPPGGHPCPYHVKVTVTSNLSGLVTEQVIQIYVKLAGDADGSGRVDIRDKRLVRDAFGSYPGHPNWDPRADVDCSDRVDIRDKRIVRDQFGDTGCQCP